MRAIIPAKASSTRTPNKNWRDFYDGLSLVDINIKALLACGLPAADLYVSCEDAGRLEQVSTQWGVTPLLRAAYLCDNSVCLTEWIRQICAQLPGDDDIIWSQVCDPLFNEHGEALRLWPEAKQNGHDSLCVVHPIKAYLLDDCRRPLGWQWGEWHTPSQQLPTFYTFPFTMSVLTRASIDRTGYHVGTRPYWFASSGGSIDIDTPEDFEAAQWGYAKQIARSSMSGL